MTGEPMDPQRLAELRDRCPECDAPLATLEDHAAWLEAGEPDDYRSDLCWATPGLVSPVHGGALRCMREPVDWRARAIAAERARDDARDLLQRMDQRLVERQRERDEARRLAEQWRANPYGSSKSPFPWEPTP